MRVEDKAYTASERAYRSLFRGERALLSEMGIQTSAVKAFLEYSGETPSKMSGQYVLPFDGAAPGEMVLWIPERVKEKEIRTTYENAKKKLVEVSGNVRHI